MSNADFQAQVSEDIRLRLVKEKDASDYAAIVANDYDYLAEWTQWPRHSKTEADFLDFIRSSQADFAAGTSMNCAIEFKGTLVGTAGFNKIDRSLSMAEIGYWIRSDFQRKGIVTRACRFFIDHAFNELDLEKVQISVATQNSRSRAICERLGMKLEGIITNKERIGERIYDHAIYGTHSNRE